MSRHEILRDVGADESRIYCRGRALQGRRARQEALPAPERHTGTGAAAPPIGGSRRSIHAMSDSPATRSVRHTRVVRATALAVMVLLGASACSDDDTPAEDATTVEPGGENGDDTPAGDGSGDEGTAGTGGAEAASVVELAERIEENGHTCTLEYEGLRDGDKELSLCTIGGEQVTLSIWFDADQLEEFRSAEPAGLGGITLIGPNWTIDLADPQLAETLAADLEAEIRED